MELFKGKARDGDANDRQASSCEHAKGSQTAFEQDTALMTKELQKKKKQYHDQAANFFSATLHLMDQISCVC